MLAFLFSHGYTDIKHVITVLLYIGSKPSTGIQDFDYAGLSRMNNLLPAFATFTADGDNSERHSRWDPKPATIGDFPKVPRALDAQKPSRRKSRQLEISRTHSEPLLPRPAPNDRNNFLKLERPSELCVGER